MLLVASSSSSFTPQVYPTVDVSVSYLILHFAAAAAAAECYIGLLRLFMNVL
jgi:hypothetical protein